MVHPWRSLSPAWPRVDGEQFMQPLASGTAHDMSQLGSAQPEEGEKPQKQRCPKLFLLLVSQHPSVYGQVIAAAVLWFKRRV